MKYSEFNAPPIFSWIIGAYKYFLGFVLWDGNLRIVFFNHIVDFKVWGKQNDKHSFLGTCHNLCVVDTVGIDPRQHEAVLEISAVIKKR